LIRKTQQLYNECGSKWVCSFDHKQTIFSGAVTIRQRPRLDNRIVGGWPVNIEDFPYQVKL